jgi:hypothetical protein
MQMGPLRGVWEVDESQCDKKHDYYTVRGRVTVIDMITYFGECQPASRLNYQDNIQERLKMMESNHTEWGDQVRFIVIDYEQNSDAFRQFVKHQ